MAVLGTTTLTGCNSIPDFIATGSIMTFQQTSAPTSWTKLTTHDNKALRVVSGTASSGGSTAFTSVFTSRTPAGSVSVSNAAVTLSTSEIPSHTHTTVTTNNMTFRAGITGGPQSNWFADSAGAPSTAATGSSGSHTHSNTASFSGSAMDFAVQYVDLIIASKN